MRNMESFRLRRSNIAAVTADRTEGEVMIQKQENFPKLISESSSWGSDTTEEDLLRCELGRRPSKQAVGTPIRKLIAEEMLRETESKRSPSLIARLMGLDGLPAQQHSHKQQKRSSENYLVKKVSTEKVQKNGTTSSRRSSRRSSKEEQEFKDVFEVLDSLKRESSGSYSLHETTNTKLTESEMAFIQQKFKEAKHLSTDEKLQDSKEFLDTIKDLDSNKDLLLKFLEQPDSLFTKHLHDLQGAPPQTNCGYIPTMKPSHASEYESARLGCKIDRKVTPSKSRRKTHDNFYSLSDGRHVCYNSCTTSNVELEKKEVPTALPTRIVVLKPNIGKLQNVTTTISSPCSSHDFLSDSRKHAEIPGIKNREAQLHGKKKFPIEADPSRYKTEESREIAKEITRQMRNSFGSSSISVGFRGYAGDESSSNRSEIESASESDVTTVTSRNSTDWSNRYWPSSSHSTESSVSREARKRLSERWKMTHKSVDMGVVSRSSTLGEMLAVPDREVRPGSSNAMISDRRSGCRFDVSDGQTGCFEPLGISSRDGWKDGCVRNLSRSKSVPASSTAAGSPKTGMRRETFCNDRYKVPKEVMQRERNKTIKMNFDHREGSSSRTSRAHSRRSRNSHCPHRDQSDTFPETHCSESNNIGDAPFEEIHMVSETPATVAADTGLVTESVVDVASESMVIPPKTTESELSVYTPANGSSSNNNDILRSQETSNEPAVNVSVPMQQPVAEVESPARSKEADQPSPVSVLETPFPDDLSSNSECFESLSADLHGLRMQLELLKLESQACAEGSMLISSDEEAEDESVGFPGERVITEDNKELLYIADMMLESGINDADTDTFITAWHSLECPVNPLIFEELEKKYGSHESWPRSERRLLFDRINLAIAVVYQEFVDPLPWVRPASRVAPRWSKNDLKDGLHAMLESQNKKANKHAEDNVLAGESEWLDLQDDMDVIGREIERLLIEELVKELVVM